MHVLDHNKGFISRTKLLALTAVVLFFLVVIISFFKPSGNQQSQYSSIITPTTFIPFATIQQSDFTKVLDKDIRDMHWLNSNELEYTFSEPSNTRRFVAKTDGKQESVLFHSEDVKISEIFWSVGNNAIVFDYGSPYKSYILTNGVSLATLPIIGYAFSWSPDGSSVFYLDASTQGKPLPKLYNPKKNENSVLPLQLPDFQVSLWSPVNNFLLLYNYNEETSKGTIYLYIMDQNTLFQVASDISFPSWSPDGKTIGYMKDDGIYVNSNNKEQRIYQNTRKFFSYGWINNQEIIVYDGSEFPSKFLTVDVLTGNKKQVIKNLSVQLKQRVEFLISPNKKTLAIATEKNGLWFAPEASFSFTPAP